MTPRDSAPPEATGRHLSLRFLSGRCKGSEYVLTEGEEVVVGRGNDADLMLLEGIVSRHHARFTLFDAIVTVEDLGSTNGTFVNGDRVRQRRLKQGDRVLIGTSILKVVWSDAPAGAGPARPAAQSWDDLDTTTATGGRKMSGDLEEVGVPDLLEMFLSSELSGVLVLRQGQAEGRLTVRAGQIERVTLSTLPDAPPPKLIQRLLGWASGTFAIRPYQLPDGERLDLSIRQLLVEGLFRLDELTMLRAKLPGPSDGLVIAQPLGPPLRALSDAELDLLQLCHNAKTIDEVLDQTAETDWSAAQRLLRLVDAGYLRRA
ncbi:MAG: FHA domain-containing protein [Deltaproteobacteria bacterium]|jgi:hypothetical protein|nr:FHA domain-containing protein [Deltaproteobacteria bacterium]MBW2534750.1 FHA domain-containing protein [Deltaproteobacteria bacterium]